MAQQFNIVAQLQLRGPANVTQVVNNIQKQLSGLSANINININQASLNALNQVTKNLQNVASASSKAQKNFNNFNRDLSRKGGGAAQAAKNLNEAATAAESFGKQSALAVKRFAAFSVGAGIMGGFIASLKSGVSAAIDFEREMVKVSQVTGRSLVALGSLEKEITSLSTSLGVASSELVNVSRILSQTGLSAREVKSALKALAQSSLAPTFKDMTSTAEGAIAIMRQFNVTADQVGKKLGAINAVAGSFAVESQDLIFAIRRAGGAFKAAGGQLEELLALFTSVRATTRESAETIATGFRTIFTRMQRPRTVEFLKAYGVELQNLQGNFVGPFKAVERLSKALSQLSSTDPRFQQIIEELGGFRQVSKVIPLIQQFGTAQKALTVALRGQGSLAKDAASAQQSLAVQISKVREQFQALMRDITSSQSFKSFAGTALSLAKAFINVGEALKPILPMMAMLGAFQGLRMGSQFMSGFAGGFGGKGGGPGSSSMPQQAKERTQISAVQKNSQFLNSNTQALNKLTSSVNRMSSVMGRSAMASSLGRPTHKGGKPQFGPGFASGGVVPGVGSGDTVPAMLEPGEFVIRKHSVKKYGASNLSKLNRGGRARKKFARGGRPTTGDVSRGRRLGGGARGQSYADSRSKRFGKRMQGGAGKAYVFDFDDTLAVSDAVVKEGASDPFEDFRGKKGAKFVRSAKATKISSMARRRASRGHDIHVLTARPGDRSTRSSIGQFMRGIGAPAKSVIGVGGTPGPGGTASKKAAVLKRLKAQYGSITFLDDDVENVLAAQKVKGVKSIRARKNRGGSISRRRRNKFAEGGTAFDDFLASDNDDYSLGAAGGGGTAVVGAGKRGREHFGKETEMSIGGAFLQPIGLRKNFGLRFQ